MRDTCAACVKLFVTKGLKMLALGLRITVLCHSEDVPVHVASTSRNLLYLSYLGFISNGISCLHSILNSRGATTFI